MPHRSRNGLWHNSSMDAQRITRVEWGWLEGQRPRSAGSNARLGDHGVTVGSRFVRLTTSEGATGFGPCWASEEKLASLVGTPLRDLISTTEGVASDWLWVEYPLWDLAGQITGKPVYALLAGIVGAEVPEQLEVPCYDTTLYFDDLHLTSTQEAADLLAEEARFGYERGHRAFKLKVGRGARHLPMDEGTARDIAIIHAVRAAVGQCGPILLDANNGYNLNLTKYVLAETADCGIYWMEEAFHEDAVLYRDLKEWLTARHLPVLIADGEGEASPSLMRWAKEGLVDVIQYDIFGHGTQRWLQIGRQLLEWGARSAPHHYGAFYGNFAAPHLAVALPNFTFAEWDEVTMPGVDTTAYSIREGKAHIPALPGYGLALEESTFRNAVQSGGGELSD